MDEHYDEYQGKFIFFNDGRKGRITEFMDKYNILELAKKNGLKTLETKAVARGVLPENIEYPVITRSIAPNIGGWKSNVHICENEKELLEAFEKSRVRQFWFSTILIRKTKWLLRDSQLLMVKLTFLQ